jgi:hypothetical protein
MFLLLSLTYSAVTLLQAMLSCDSSIDVQLHTKIMDMVRSRLANSTAAAAAAAATSSSSSSSSAAVYVHGLLLTPPSGTCRLASGWQL